MLLGAHMSIAGGVDKSIPLGKKIGCDTIQIFTKSSNQWEAKPLAKEEIENFKRNRKEMGIDLVVAHDAYLINLGSPDDLLWKRSIDAFVMEMNRCEQLEIPFLITHPGSHMGAGEEAGLMRIAEAIDRIHSRTKGFKTMVVLETTAGQGTNLGYRFEHLAKIIKNVKKKCAIGICFDTCHAFAAGYEIRDKKSFDKTFREFDRILGLNLLKAFHLNDSLKGLGSRVDRHQHIGKGEMGLEPFRFLLNDRLLKKFPMYLETPKGPDYAEDVQNLKILRSLIRNR
ncbi:MAG: deoxyribonuclease IV [Acidobacteriota bacterium]